MPASNLHDAAAAVAPDDDYVSVCGALLEFECDEGGNVCPCGRGRCDGNMHMRCLAFRETVVYVYIMCSCTCARACVLVLLIFRSAHYGCCAVRGCGW